jgi:hypothetical protein
VIFLTAHASSTPQPRTPVKPPHWRFPASALISSTSTNQHLNFPPSSHAANDRRTPQHQMEIQDGVGVGLYSGFEQQNGEVAMSPADSKQSKLQLPVSCDPPGPGNPVKQLVWIVSLLLLCEVVGGISAILHRSLHTNIRTQPH